MSKALSVDLRVRVLSAVRAGATHRQAAERFGVSAASVSRWRAREREQGDARPKALGGDRRSKRIEACGEAVLSALALFRHPRQHRAIALAAVAPHDRVDADPLALHQAALGHELQHPA